MDGYEVLAHGLKAEGVDFLVAFPHQRLIEVAAKAGILPIICRQERAGVNMVDGFSRISNGRKFGVFTMQQGPGAENAFGGVAQAFADSVPILHLPGGEPLARQGIQPTFSAVAQLPAHHQVGRPDQHAGQYPAHASPRRDTAKAWSSGPGLIGDAR